MNHPRSAKGADIIPLMPGSPADSAAPRSRSDALGAGPPHREQTLDRVLQHLGSTLLEPLAGDPERAVPVGEVAIYDLAAGAPLPRNAIVLGVGADDRESVLRALDEVERHGAAALVVRSPFDVDDAVARKVESGGLVLIGLAPGADWQQLTTLLASSLRASRRRAMSPHTLGGVPAGDLFGLANAICTLIDAPVIIEDRNSNVLAFSTRQDEADFVRIDCILGRRTPETYAREDERRGAIRAIRESPGPVYLDPIQLDDERPTLPRVAVGIRAGDEPLGTIWAAVRGPLSPERNQLLLDASHLATLHLLQLRASSTEQRLTADLMAEVLAGGADAPAALARLGLDGAPCIVLAMSSKERATSATLDSSTLARRAAERQRAAAALAVHLQATRPGAAVAVEPDDIYAIVPTRRVENAEATLEATCRTFLRQSSVRTAMLIGIGRIAETVSELARSRIDADRAVRVLQSMDDGPDVARATEIDSEALTLELRDLADRTERGPSAAYSRLVAYDQARNASMVDTLRAWLDAHGDIIEAAAAAHVHQNTFRYRLRRSSEIGGFDLNDPQARFALELELRLFPPEPRLDE